MLDYLVISIYLVSSIVAFLILHINLYDLSPIYSCHFISENLHRWRGNQECWNYRQYGWIDIMLCGKWNIFLTHEAIKLQCGIA